MTTSGKSMHAAAAFKYGLAFSSQISQQQQQQQQQRAAIAASAALPGTFVTRGPVAATAGAGAAADTAAAAAGMPTSKAWCSTASSTLS
jgi:hypothetical protein